MANILEYIEPFKEKILSSQDIYLTAHTNPDGDSIGSTLALAKFIKEKMNRDVDIIIDDNIPSSYKFMPGIDLINQQVDDIENIDLLITLDSADLGRLALPKSIIDKAKYIINIDHHITNTNFGDINIVDGYASSTGEVLYEMFEDIDSDISKDIATCLYVSISTDTGSFKYTNTNSKTHLIASKLLEKDIDLETINIELYQNRSLEKTKLLMEGVKNLKLYRDNTVGIVAITQEILDSCNADSQDTDLIVDFIRNIDTVNLACTIRPIDKDSSKASLRSKKDIDVSKIAGVFGGGGHAKAAGSTINSNVSEAEEQITKEILRYLGD